MMSIKQQINKFFVYGTLRPDIIAPWSDITHNNPDFKLKYYKAELHYSKMYLCPYGNYPVAIHNKQRFHKDQKVIGYILETDNIEETMKVLDEIEEYPEMYGREIIQCLNLDSNQIEEAYFYTFNDSNNINLRELEHNDWFEYTKR